MSSRFRQIVFSSLFLFGALGAFPAVALETGCALDPISLPLFGATPAAVIAATPAAEPDAPRLDEATATEAITNLFVCIGEESQALRYAIFTDRYLANLFIGEDPADQPAFERMIAAGAAPEATMPTLTGVSDLETREDGRAAVTIEYQGAAGSVEDRLLLAWDAGQEQWLIDAVVSLDPPLGTASDSVQDQEIIDAILSVGSPPATPEA